MGLPNTSKPAVVHTTLTLFDTPESRQAPEKTFVTFGLPRGGTTAVAGCLRKLGIFIGDNLPLNLEDRAFSSAKGPEPDIVAARDAAYPVWGWKYPSAMHYLDRLAGDLRNPRFILVTRDQTANALAISERHEDFGEMPALEIVLERYQKNFSLIQKLQKPTLMVSYEKLLLKTEQTVREIVEFLGIEVPEAAVEEAVGFVQPGAYGKVKTSKATWDTK